MPTMMLMKSIRKVGINASPNDVKTINQGIADVLNDGSILVEEHNHGRLIFFNKEGNKEWEFINKDNNNDRYFVSWSRIIDDKNLISKIKEKIKNTQCQN